MEKKIIEEKENMKVQQAAFDKILPGVQARCAVFLFWWSVVGGRWSSTFWFFKSLDNNMLYTLGIYVYM